MDLKNQNITVEELLSNPKAKAILKREFPGLLNSPMILMAKNMPLKNVLNLVRCHVPASKLNSIIAEIEEA